MLQKTKFKCVELKMKILGEPKIFLSMKIKRDRENQIITLSQSAYTENYLKNLEPYMLEIENRRILTIESIGN